MIRFRTIAVLVSAIVMFCACDDDKPPPIPPVSGGPAKKPAASAKPARTPPAASASASAAAPAANPPEMISEAMGSGSLIALFGKYVFWVVPPGANCTDTPEKCKAANDGKIFRVDKKGGIPKEMAGSLGSVGSLAFSNADVYWTMCQTVDYVQRCQVTSAPIEGGKRKLFYEAGPDLVENVTWTGTKVVWGEPGKKRIQTFGGGEGKPATFAKAGVVTDVTFRAGSVYWTEGRTAAPEGTVKKAPAEGGAPSTIASKRRMPRHIAADDAFVYWVEDTELEGGKPAQFIVRVKLAGGEPETVTKGLSFVQEIAVAGKRVVFVTSDAVNWVPVSGGTPQVLASNQQSVHGPAADETHAYWLANKKVWRIELPK